MIIVKTEAINGFHPYEFQSGRTECWQHGYIEVPKDIEGALITSKGYCDLVIEDGTLINVVHRPDYEPTTPRVLLTREDEIEAFLIEQVYKLTLLELGVNE